MKKPAIIRKHDKVKSYAKTGRSQELIRQRDEKLALRLYFHTEVKRRRFDDVLNILSEEFFISPTTIYIRLRDEFLSMKIEEIYERRPSLKEIKEKSKPFRCDYYPEEANRYKKLYS